MRFSHFLKYNSVPEWQSHYLDYSELKNLIYTLQTDELQSNTIITDNQVIDNDKLANNAQEQLSPSNGQKGSQSNFTSRLKSRWFSKSKKKNTKTSLEKTSVKGSTQAYEETIELDDLSINPDHESRWDKSHLQARNISTKLFNSRSASVSSDERTLFSPLDSFIASLSVEKTKIDDFYKRMEAKFYQKFDSLVKDLDKEGVTNFVETFHPDESPETISPEIHISTKESATKSFDMHANLSHSELRSRFSEDDIDEDEDVELDFALDDIQENTALLNYSQVNVESQKKSILKQSIINLYIDLCQLKSFIELNKIGFTKITKKFDKVLNMNTRIELIESGEFFKDTYIFQNSTLEILNLRIQKVVEFFALISEQANDIYQAKKELKSLLHDHIVWERSKTWKDMLGLVSQDKDIQIDVNEEESKKSESSKLQIDFYKWPLPRPLKFRNWTIENFCIPKLFFTPRAYKLAFIITFTGILLGVKTFNDRVEGRCMALVECCAFLWASEAIPLHITAFLVPLLTVLFKVLKDENGHVMKASAASAEILSTMWSSTIMILLAGFTLAEVLSQYNIAKILASWLLAFAGTKPRNVLLMAMGVVFFLSMWISNVASPVLTYSLLAPLLEPLDADTPFAKALVMGVALAADIGGMSSPISSPQNIISMDYLKPYGIGWGQFFAVALPSGILAMLFAWGLMCTTFKINTTKLEKFTPIKTTLTIKQWYIIIVTVGTILLWCVEAQIEGAFGSSGQIAILPIVLFFGTGLLSTKDLNTFPWSIVILAMGGIALGKAVSSSGLLATIATALQRKIQNDGLFAILCIFGILMLVVGTFVSHTVSAIIIIPLVQEVGDNLSSPKAAPTLVFGCALLASCGMGLASAGFPNVTAVSLTDKKGNRYLDSLTFITRGVPASLLAFLCVITLGYGIMISVLKGAPAGSVVTSTS